ncbi:LysR family transcriptional regulator [Sphingomonas aerolata]|uniref:LysR family transcriptional regulator n=1 Tax=Sphingomonas aerolata TaxID=185951 RepID=UPI002FE382FC
MDRLDVLNLFLRVAEAGSFSKAAQQSGIAQSTASKRIASLEKRLGAHLLRRTSRGIALTSAGQHYYDEALRLVDAFEQLDETVGKRERTPAGVLRLTCPPGLATSYLLPRLGSFRAEFPRISLDFVVSQGNLNLVEERIDLAIRFGDLEDSEMRSRQVGTAEAIVVASAAYLRERGEPTTPYELRDHALIASARNGKPRSWAFRRGQECVTIDPHGPIQSDDVELTRGAVKSGLGIAHAASWLFKDELVSGEVRRLLTNYQCLIVPISAVWSGDRSLPRRAAVFLTYLEAICASEPTLRIR